MWNFVSYWKANTSQKPTLKIQVLNAEMGINSLFSLVGFVDVETPTLFKRTPGVSSNDSQLHSVIVTVVN